jgi:hypothetical protein
VKHGRRALLVGLGVVVLFLFVLLGYAALANDKPPTEIVEELHNRISCGHPRPDPDDC